MKKLEKTVRNIDMHQVVVPWACPLDVTILPDDYLAQVDQLNIPTEEKLAILFDLGYELKTPDEIGY